MAGEVLTTATSVLCAHSAPAQATPGPPQVRVGGQPVVTVNTVHNVQGCAFTPPQGNGPCVTGRWLVGATRVRTGGAPLAVMGNASTCTPTGTPLTVLAPQPRVRAR